MDEKKREFDPMFGTFPNRKEIDCKTCVHRDHTTVELDGKIIDVGTTKSFCAVYEQPPKTNGKPIEVLFHGVKCEYYNKE